MKKKFFFRVFFPLKYSKLLPDVSTSPVIDTQQLILQNVTISWRAHNYQWNYQWGFRVRTKKYQRKKMKGSISKRQTLLWHDCPFLEGLWDLVTTAVQKGSYFILSWCITLCLLVLGEQKSERNFLAVSKIKEPSLNSCDSCSCDTCYLWAFDNSLGVSENLWTAEASCFVTRRLSWFTPDSKIFVIRRTGQKN